jgi:integrase
MTDPLLLLLPSRFRFTQRAIEQLPAHRADSASRTAEYSDSELTGLRLLVSKAQPPRKMFLFRFTQHGRKRALKIGEFPSLSLPDARRKVLAWRADLDRGIDPALARDHLRNMPTFLDFAYQDYMPFATANKRSANSDLSKLKVHLVPYFGSRRLNEIGVRDVQTYLGQLKQTHSPATVNRHLSVLSKLFGCAVQWSVLDKNPCGGVAKVAENNAQQRFLSPDEIGKLYRAMAEQGQRSNMTIAALKFLLLTGTRKNEALRARWEHVDLARGIWLLPQTKNGKAHYVMLNDEAKLLLERLPRLSDCPWVFPGRNSNQPLVEVRRCLNQLTLAAGIPPLRVHDLRHSFASICAQSGASLLQIKGLLNHASTATTQRYVHLTTDDLRVASQKVSLAVNAALRTP